MEQIKYNSPLGTLYLVANNKALCRIDFEKDQAIPFVKKLENSSILEQTVRELDEYFAQKRKKFSVPLHFEKGTEFQKKVWKALQTIPFGKTISYKELAERIQNEKAIRAVGTANGKNPLCIIIPCHRVIASDGGLGGYTGGIDKKEKLLKVEGISLAT